MKDFFKIIASVKNNLSALIAFKKLKQIEREYTNYIIIVATAGIGDICYALSYLGSLKNRHQKKVLVVCAPYSNELITFFPDIDEIICLSERQTKHFKQLSRSIFGEIAYNDKKKPIFTCDAWVFWPWNIIDLPGINFFKILNYAYYKLDGIGNIQYPVVPECDIRRFGFSNLNKTVIINPYSNYLNADSQIFADSVKLLQSKGFDLYTNVSSLYHKAIYGTKPLLCSLQELYSIVKQVKCFVSVRSGIVDFTINSGGSFLVIYNHEADPAFKKIYSLKNWETQCNLTEYDADNRDEILNYLQKL